MKTNEQIIFEAALDLMERGLIKSTGRTITIEINDQEMEVPEPEPIHTFAAWKELGYSVKKGEHAVASIIIWKHVASKADMEAAEAAQEIMKMDPMTEEEKKEVGRFIKKKAFFFTAAQVQEIKQKEAV